MAMLQATGGNLPQNSFSLSDNFDFRTDSGRRNGFSAIVTSVFPFINTNLPVSFPITWLVKSPRISPFCSKV